MWICAEQREVNKGSRSNKMKAEEGIQIKQNFVLCGSCHFSIFPE